MDENHIIERYRQERDEQYNRRVEVEEELARVRKERDEAKAAVICTRSAIESYQRTIRRWVNENNRLHGQISHLHAAIDRRDAALRFARPLVEKWCHYQGNTKELFDEYLGPIDAVLSPSEEEKEAH